MPLRLLALVLMPLSLTACGPDKLLSDQPSPKGHYHVQVRACPTPGGKGDSAGTTQVSLLPAHKSEGCWDDINSIAQFRLQTPVEDLKMVWLSDTQLWAWSPEFQEHQMPYGYSYQDNAPVQFVFRPKK